MNNTTVYYHHDGTIECICIGSPVSLDKYDSRVDLIKGYIKHDDDIQKIRDGKACLSNFIIENIDADTIKLGKRIQNILRKADSINDYKVEFTDKDHDILIEYNRTKNILKIKNIKNIIAKLYLWFTLKNDPTILVLPINDLKLVIDTPEIVLEDIRLSKEFDLYCNMNKNFNFGYKEND